MIDVKDILEGIPINGHILIQVDKGQVKEELGLSRDSALYIPQEKSFASSSSKGVVVKMAKDAFGDKYKEKYGANIDAPQLGDIVHFVPYQSNMMDKDGEYYLITDDGVKFIQRKGK